MENGHWIGYEYFVSDKLEMLTRYNGCMHKQSISKGKRMLLDRSCNTFNTFTFIEMKRTNDFELTTRAPTARMKVKKATMILTSDEMFFYLGFQFFLSKSLLDFF